MRGRKAFNGGRTDAGSIWRRPEGTCNGWRRVDNNPKIIPFISMKAFGGRVHDAYRNTATGGTCPLGSPGRQSWRLREGDTRRGGPPLFLCATRSFPQLLLLSVLAHLVCHLLVVPTGGCQRCCLSWRRDRGGWSGETIHGATDVSPAGGLPPQVGRKTPSDPR